MRERLITLGAAILLLTAQGTRSEVLVVSSHNGSDSGAAPFRFKDVAAPVTNDAAASGNWTIVDGTPDPNGGGLAVLGDGKLPTEDDQPRANFFFSAGTSGGRLLLDMGREVRVGRISTYSWHGGTRGPQVYSLYAVGGKAVEESLRPARPVDPETRGWKLIGKADTRREGIAPGGQYGVSLTDPSGSLGTFRYLLMDVLPTEQTDPFGNTFFSEVDVIDADASEPLREIAGVKSSTLELFRTDDGAYEFALDVADTPDLADWAREKVIPMAREWYPKLAVLLASEGYKVPARVQIIFDPRMQGVAATSGTRVRCAAGWFRQNLKGEALGAVFHELVHVAQQYGRRRGPSPVPGWLTEGLTDYIRWFLYEPETKGAEITARNLSRARYDGSYRITGNFLNWVSTKYEKNLAQKLNATIREGRYDKSFWSEISGKSLEDLGADWRKEMEEKVAAASKAPAGRPAGE